MIVRMAKVTVVTLAAQQEETLRALQALGLLHVQRAVRHAGTSASEAANRLRAAERATQVLAQHARPGAPDAGAPPAEQIVARVLDAQDRLAQLEEQRAHVQRQYAALAVWGEFDPARIKELAQHGVYVKLYQCEPQQVPEPPEGCVLHELARSRHHVAFAVVAGHDFSLELAETPLPDAPLSTLAQRSADLDAARQQLHNELAALAPQQAALSAHALTLADELARAQARDNVGQVSALAYLTGFCPQDAVARITAAAHAQGWGVLVDDPAPDDPVPTLIRNPRWLRPVEAVFNFIDTFPGYRERDISGVFYLFFAVFYAMLIGDACYGLIFLALTALVHLRWGARIPRQPLYLMYILNLCTVVYGVLTGSYFGVILPAHAWLRRWAVLNNTDFQSMVYVCFIIAAVQMLIAHVWNMLQMLNSIKAVRELGWCLVVIGAYFVADKLILERPIPLWVGFTSATGLALAFAGSVIGLRGEELIGELFQFPFKVINCFGDIASYMRLFAVGFAGAAMAQAFNAIAAQIGFHGIMRSAVVVLILALGHALNLVLGLLSVMVHGLRLNMLEFSGHLGQEWSGVKYQPLAHIPSAKTTAC